MTRDTTRFLGIVVAACAATWLPAANANVLADLYRLAAQNDLTLQNAAFQRDVAVESRPRTRAPLLPQLVAQGYVRANRRTGQSTDTEDAGTTFRDLDESYTSTGATLSLSQTIFDWSAFKSFSAADRTVAQAESAYALAQQDLIIRLVSAYFTVLIADDTLRADQDALVGFGQQLDRLQEGFKSGVAPITDVKSAQAAFDAASAQVLLDTTTAANARRALAVLVGRPIGALAPLREQITLAPPNPSNVESWVRTAATDNPGVISAHFAAEAAARQADAAFGKHFPTLDAVGQVGGISSNSEFGNDVYTNYVGLRLTLPIFQGGAVNSLVRQAEAISGQNNVAYQLALRTAEQNARNHFEGVVNGIATVNAAASAVSSQQSSLLATEVGAKVGVRSVIDILAARQGLAGAQKVFAQARYNYLVNLLSLKGDVGQLTTRDLEDVDRLLMAPVSAAPRPR
jgi:outer membrane protein